MITSLAVNLKLLHPDYTDLTPTGEPTPLDLRTLNDMGLLRKVGGVFSLTHIGPIIARHECVFRKKAANQEAASPQPIPPIAAQQAAEEAPAEAP